MGKCDLSIQLDDPKAIHPGGGTVRGVVRVRADDDVTCNVLEVTSVWKTHGRGNVATGEPSSEVLFSGDWQGGQHYEYRFELPIAQWPPSYHGHYLNVDHYVEARAKIPWAFDPKASEAFFMRPTCGPEGVTRERKAIQISGPLGCLVGIVFVAIFASFLVGFGMAFADQPLILLPFLIIPAIIAIVVFFRFVLPRFLLGNVTYELKPDSVSPGEPVHGELVITPRKNVSINGICLQFKACEKVVSGSGTNRTTHTHVFYDQTEKLQTPTTLTLGKVNRFPFSVTVPPEAPYSLDLDDNDLIWSANLRVDIPRWPDWKKELKFSVVPSARPDDASSPPIESDRSARAASGGGPEPGSEITFAETVGHFWKVRGDDTQAETLANAVAGLTFDMEACVERRLLYSGDEDPHLHEDAYAVWAHVPEPPLPLVLYVPHHLADEFEQVGRERWNGRGTVVGWDARHGRLQVKLEATRS